MSCCKDCDECVETPTNSCLEDCGCPIEITSLACIRHDGEDLPCIEVVKGETLEAIIQKINDKICVLAPGTDGDPGADGQGLDHVSFTGTPGTEGQPGQTSTYTIWGDVAETINLGTFVVYNGINGQGVDHTSFTSTTGPVLTAGAAGQTDTYTLWGDALETINLGTFIVYNGNNGIDGYDSGWIPMNDFNTTYNFGLPAYTVGWSHPKIRVVGKIVFLEGDMMIPLSSDLVSGTTLLTDVAQYPSTYRTDIRVYTGTSGGFSYLSNALIRTKFPILPQNLAPSELHILNNFEIAYRAIDDLMSFAELNLTTVLPKIILNTNGTLEIGTLGGTDDDGTTGTVIPNSPIHQLVSRVHRGAFAPSYNIFYSEYDMTTSLDNRVSPISISKFPADFDGKIAKDLGGFRIKATTSYPLGDSITLSQIQQAIAQIQS